MVDRYEARRNSFMEKVLAAPDAQAVAAAFLYGVADFAADTSGKNPPGCLMLQSGLSCGEPEIPDDLARRRAEKECLLRKRLEGARKDGDLPEECRPRHAGPLSGHHVKRHQRSGRPPAPRPRNCAPWRMSRCWVGRLRKNQPRKSPSKAKHARAWKIRPRIAQSAEGNPGSRR